jgi:hypothetical protein
MAFLRLTHTWFELTPSTLKGKTDVPARKVGLCPRCFAGRTVTWEQFLSKEFYHRPKIYYTRINSVGKWLQLATRGKVSVWQIMFWDRLEIKWIVWEGDIVRHSQYLDYITLNGRMIQRWWIGKDLKESDPGFNHDTVLEFALEGRNK